MAGAADRRVVVTGLGPVTPIGTGKEAFWQALLDGVCAGGPIAAFDTTDYTSTIAAEINDFDPTPWLDRREARHMDRFTQFAMAAGLLAAEDAGLTVTAAEAGRAGVLMGSGIGGTAAWWAQHEILRERGPHRVSPYFVPMLIANIAGGQLAIRLGLKGPNFSINSACATGNHAIGEAAAIIRRGDADVMIAGGTEAAITPLAVAGFCALRALTTRNDDPTHASRPFDAGRDGFLMGEGAGALVLETLGHARDRGAPIYGEVVGYGTSCDAYHITAPDAEGEGAVRAMTAALAAAGLSPEQVDYVNAHGTSTQLNDVVETKALKQVFGEHAYRLAVSSTKSQIGHMLGAAGAAEAIACLLAIQHQVIPATVNLVEPDPECDLDYVPGTPRPSRVRVAMSNGFGFGGQNAVLVLGAVEG